MLTVTLTMVAVLAGLAVATASLARIQRETEELLDGYATVLAEARERYRVELNYRRSAARADRTRSEDDPSARQPAD